MIIIICHNKPPDKKWCSTCSRSETKWVDDDMPGRDRLRILGFWKRRGVEEYRLKLNVEFFFRIWSDPQRWVEILVTTRCAARWKGCQHSMYLSPRVTNGWKRKEIKPFVSETTESTCIIIIIIIIIDILMAIQRYHSKWCRNPVTSLGSLLAQYPWGMY